MAKKYDNVSALYQTVDYKDANIYLAKGYKILEIYSTKIPMGGGQEQVQPCYVLGLEGK